MNFIVLPQLDPVIASFGPLAIRWYSLAYILGIVLGFYLIKHINKKVNKLPQKVLDDLIMYMVFGIILGGRLGYVLFYNLPFYVYNPLEAFYIWQGGMSFHGGLIGSITAIYLLARKNKLHFFDIMDFIALVTPIGLFCGRVANFINMELWGKVTSKPWGVIFPNLDPYPRHPSQLYEAFLEGVVLFIILMVLASKKEAFDKKGLISGVFLTGYGISRFIVEFFREPDAQLGLLFNFISMGQLLCLPMIGFGVYFVVSSKKFIEKK